MGSLDHIAIWNYYAHSGPQKNTHLEGWHNRMKRIAKKAHPNLYEVLELFQRETEVYHFTTVGGRWGT